MAHPISRQTAEYFMKLHDVVKSPQLQSFYKIFVSQSLSQIHTELKFSKDEHCAKCLMRFDESNSNYVILPKRKHYKFVKKCQKKSDLTKFQHKYLKNKSGYYHKMIINCGHCSSKFKKYISDPSLKGSNNHSAAQQRKAKQTEVLENNNNTSNNSNNNQSKKSKKGKNNAGLDFSALEEVEKELQLLNSRGVKRKLNEIENSTNENSTARKPKNKMSKVAAKVVPGTSKATPATSKASKKQQKAANKSETRSVVEIKKEVAEIEEQRRMQVDLTKREKKKLKHKLNNLVSSIKSIEANNKQKEKNKSGLQSFLETLQL